jgi:hypothetical protein
MNITEREIVVYCSKYGTFYSSANPTFEKNKRCRHCKKTRLICYMKTEECILCLPCVEILNYPTETILTPPTCIKNVIKEEIKDFTLDDFVSGNDLEQHIIQIGTKPSYRTMCDY